MTSACRSPGLLRCLLKFNVLLMVALLFLRAIQTFHITRQELQERQEQLTSTITQSFSKLHTHTKPKRWDSSKSAVLGLATNYSLGVYKIFVGSLRATGYNGHIILGIAKDAPPDVMQYLTTNKVTTHVVEVAEKCTYEGEKSAHDGNGDNTVVHWKCAKDYPDYKLTWARVALYRDWLLACPDCTDGVMLTDVRDSFFQRDPFSTVKPEQQRPLMVFEEHPDLDTTHWLTDFPIKTCKGVPIGARPMLCSGSTMGSREGILDYTKVMMEEFDDWKTKANCRTNMKGDDQSIHNYLYYANRFKDVISIPHRTGPINVAGFQASILFEQAKKEKIGGGNGSKFIKQGDDENWQNWFPEEYGLIDPKTGLLTNLDGNPSGQVHQFDRFGFIIQSWLNKNNNKNWPYNS